jgi:hypothetical protein
MQAKGYEIKECIIRGKGCVQRSKSCPAISFVDVKKIAYTEGTCKKIAKCSNYCAQAM